MRDSTFSQKRQFADARGVEWWAYASAWDGLAEPTRELVFFCPDSSDRRRATWSSRVEWLEDLSVEELLEQLARAEPF